MAEYFGRIVDGVVTEVRKATPERIASRPDLYTGDWLSAGQRRIAVGWEHHGDHFRPPQPFPSWIWNGTNWVAPEPHPEDGNFYAWDEDALKWVLIAEAPDE